MHRKFILLLLSLAGSAFLPAAQAQSRHANSIVWHEPNPAAVRNAVLSIALYNDVNVAVAFADHQLLSGEIDELRADDFTLKTQFSPQPASICFSDVHSLRWMEPMHTGDPYAIKATAVRLSLEPPAAARVRLRNHQTLHGQVRDVGELDFTLVLQDSGKSKTLRYRDVQDLSGPAESHAPDAKKVFENIGLVLAGVIMIPLALLAALTGWDGC